MNNEINLFVINTNATTTESHITPATLADPHHFDDPAKPRYLTYRVELGAG